MKLKKGQAAMEFLMTYGWAILVVLAAIGALAYFGVLSPDRFLPAKCTISGGFSCTEYKIIDTGVQMRIQNNLGVDSTNTTIWVVPKGSNSACTIALYDAGAITNGDDTGLVTYSCTAGALSGKVRADVLLNYTRSGETVIHSTTGSVSGNVE